MNIRKSFEKYLTKFRNDFNLNGISRVLFWKSQIAVISQEDFELDDTETSISTSFLIYRSVFASYFIITLLVTVGCAGDDKRPYWLIFLTNWTYTLQTVYAIFSLGLLIKQKWFAKPDRTAEPSKFYNAPVTTLPLPEKAVWILFNIVNAIPYGVTFVFWVILYPAIRDEWLGSATTCQLFSNHFAHSLNSVMALLDLFVVAIPVHITHFVFGVLYVFIYLTFSILYEASGADYPYGFDYIYPPLNWKHTPGKAASFGIASLFVFALCHLMFAYSLVKVRTLVWNKVSKLLGKYNYSLDTC